MTRNCFCILLAVFSCVQSFGQSNISGTINKYTAVSAINTAKDEVTVAGTTGFSTCSKVLIIQMKGATISLSNSSSFGNITSIGNAGNYEFAVIESISGSVVRLNKPLTRDYDPGNTGKVQMISVPVFEDAKVSGLLTGQAWNGTTGGVLVFQVKDTLSLSADIDMSGYGFTGSGSVNGYPGYYNSTAYYYASSSNEGAFKGEGVVQLSSSYASGRGKAANGGGGGNNHNAGGGGGSSIGKGGMGGREYNNSTGSTIGGIGGVSMRSSFLLNKAFLGGGGGGGQQNDGSTVSGGAGGGIIIIDAKTIIGNSKKIAANGAGVTSMTNDDGAGGGGGGGAILITATSVSNAKFDIRGGKGGSLDNKNLAICLGPGAGGGGGLLWSNVSNIISQNSIDSAGGAAGLTTNNNSPCYNTTYGAEKGDDGGTLRNLSLPGIDQFVGSLNILSSIPDKDTICDPPLATITLKVTGAAPDITLLWNTGDTAKQLVVEPTTTSSYIITGPDSLCFAPDTFRITVTPKPTLKIFQDTTICENEPVTLSASGAVTYKWDGGQTTASILVSPSNTSDFSVIGNLGKCGLDTQSCTITVLPWKSIEILSSFPDKDTICTPPLKSITLTATNIGGGTKTQWSNADTSKQIQITPVANTSITVAATEDICIIPDTFSVSVLQKQPLFMLQDTTICQGQSVQLSASGAPSYTWSTGGTGSSISVTPNITTAYFVVGNYGKCGKDTMTRTVTVIPSRTIQITSSIPDNDTVCTPPLKNITLTATGVGAGIATVWSNGDTSKQIQITPTSFTKLTVKATTEKCVSGDSFSVSVLQKQSMEMFQDTTICQGESVTLSATGAPAYRWNTGEQTSTVLVTPNTTSTYTVIGDFGKCGKDTLRRTVTVLPKPIAKFVADPIKGFQPLISTFTNQSANFSSNSWYIDGEFYSSQLDEQNTFSQIGTYNIKLVISNDLGCKDSQTISIEVVNPFLIYVPLAFTPDGNNLNDLFNPFVQGQRSFTAKIYNRWGEKIYEWTLPGQSGWDGTYMGTPCPDGVYAYVISVRDTDDHIHLYKGTITLLH